MPGIFGIVGSAPEGGIKLDAQVRQMAASMRHRDWYRASIHVGPAAAAGRIGPGFLNPERQPVFSEDRSMWIVFDGELSDPDAVRAALPQHGRTIKAAPDAELVLCTFQRHKIEGIAWLSGAYTGFIYDSRSRVGWLFNDRLGLRTCYYYVSPNGTFVFASEFKGIVATDVFQGHLDVQGVAEFLNCGFPFFERTFYEEIKCLPYGSVLSFVDGKTSNARYWDLPRAPADTKRSFEDTADEGSQLLIQATRRKLRHSGRVGVMLSGGLDSRAVAASAARFSRSLVALSLGSGRNTDQKLAARVAERLGIKYHRLAIPPDFLANLGELGTWYTDAMLPCIHLHWLPLLDSIHQLVEFVLTGYLGDILLAGVYLPPRSVVEIPKEELTSHVLNKLAGETRLFLNTALQPRFQEDVRQAFAQTYTDAADRMGTRGQYCESDRLHLATQEDRYTHAVSSLLGIVADVKYPFGDYDLLDFYGRVPAEWRSAGRLYRAMLCRAFPELVDIPCISASTQFIPTRLDSHANRWQKTWKRLAKSGRHYLYRATRGHCSLPDHATYVHYAHWYRRVAAVRDWLDSVLLDDRTLDRGFYSRGGIRKLLHLQKTRGYPFGLLARLVTFELWNRFFVDQEPPQAYPGTVNYAQEGP